MFLIILIMLMAVEAELADQVVMQLIIKEVMVALDLVFTYLLAIQQFIMAEVAVLEVDIMVLLLVQVVQEAVEMEQHLAQVEQLRLIQVEEVEAVVRHQTAEQEAQA
jgi:hypothetical protein